MAVKKLSDIEVAYEVLRSLRKIIRKTSEHSRQISSQSGLSVPQLLCLKAIAEFPSENKIELTAASVAQTVHLSAPTVTRLLDRLELAGYIARNRHPGDRRKLYLTLTELGKRRLESLPTPLHEDFLAKLKKLKRTEKEQLLASLEKVVEMMAAENIDAAPLLTAELDVKSPSTQLG